VLPLSIVEQSPAELLAYGSVPIAFTVTERWRGGPVDRPYVKDYDAIAGNRPTDWPRRFDLKDWRLAAAFFGHARVGGAAVALGGVGLDGAVGPDDAVLWDLRVHPAHRGRGVGRQLLAWAEGVARAMGRVRLLAETQDINAVACRFYAANGFTCLGIEPGAYPELPGEARVVWAKELG
jgi:GNAT superfamily N-acetyltransferase